MTTPALPQTWLHTLQSWATNAGSNRANAPSQPKPGEIWSVSWNASFLGMVLVGHFGETYAQVYPVVPSGVSPNPGVVTFQPPAQTFKVELWLAAGFGMGNFLFEQRILEALDSASLRNLVRVYLEWESSEHSVDSGASLDDDQTVQNVVTFAQSACSIEWPLRRVGEAILDEHVLQNHGLTPRDLGALTGVAPGAATALWNGMAFPTKDNLDALAMELGMAPEEFIRPFEGPEEEALANPISKARIVALTENVFPDEAAARAEVLRKALRPGRQSSGLSPQQSARVRVDNALDELMRQV